MVKIKEVLLWGNANILNFSISQFISENTDWRVIHVTDRVELELAIQTVHSSHPDIIIIHQADDDADCEVALYLLQHYPSITIIELSLRNNILEVYSKQKKLVRQSADLINVIKEIPKTRSTDQDIPQP
jgi:DNA-binding NarL/FixJ family response regulator